MIISASRRTDIPAFYSEWFINRLKEGYVLVPNPYDPDQLWHVTLSPENVDCIVLLTKNPAAMSERFHYLDRMGYRYFLQFTLTPYGKTVEYSLPPKEKLIKMFQNVSDKMGAERTVWRYDPVIVDDEHTIEWHLSSFEDMCNSLHDRTERCIISFVDPRKGAEKRFRTLTDDEKKEIASGFSKTAGAHGITVSTCAEETDLSKYGVEHMACIDREFIEGITGYHITAKDDASRRKGCRCIECFDIGMYNTCSHGCSYCYAVSDRRAVIRRMAAHDPASPLLSGHPTGKEIITDRTKPSQKDRQLRIFQY
jgi:hypothetical protein